MAYNIYSTRKGDITLDCINETIFIKNICMERTISEDYLTNLDKQIVLQGWQLTLELYEELDTNTLQYIKKNMMDYSITLWYIEKNCNPEAIETYKDLQMEAYLKNNKTICMYARIRIPR